ncbi:MAG: nuclear transport factor 2 family protein [Acidimicrobiales bacterium]
MDPSTDLAALVAREAVRDLVARYTWAGDGGRSAELAGLFLLDGVLDVGEHGGRWEGRAEIAAQLEAVAARVAAAGGVPGPVRHHVSSLVVDVASATEAAASAYFLVLTSIGVDHWGRYRDRLAVDPGDGAWRFAERRVRVDGHAEGSLMVPGGR